MLLPNIMNVAKLDESFALAPQLYPEHVADIADHGFEQLICNRPDNEEFGQPNFASIEAEAKNHNLAWVFAPVADGQITEETIKATQKALANDKKTVMFCRSGTRCSVLWAIIRTREGNSLAETLESLTAIGYDIRYLQDYIIKMAQKNQPEIF